MKRNVKKIAASVAAAMTMLTAMASTSLADSDSYIGNKYISFWFGAKKIAVGDCNEDGDITTADLVALMIVSQSHTVVSCKAEQVYDCNQDGYINNTDISLMQDYLCSHPRW